MPVSDFTAAFRTLHDEFLTALSEAFVLRRGTETTAINMAIGETEYDQLDAETGAAISTSQTFDLFCYTNAYLIGGVETLPETNDEFIRTLPDGKQEKYLAHRLNLDRVYRFTDHTHEFLRIHTRLINVT